MHLFLCKSDAYVFMQPRGDRKKLFVELQDQMVRGHFKPEMSLSQNFCIDEHVIHNVIHFAKIKKNEKVLEIGPGTGFLTRELLAKGAKVTSIEKSASLFDFLSAELSSASLTLAHADFLEHPVVETEKITAFPPYAIAGDIMQKILVEYDADSMVLVWQAEFAEKLVAFPGFPSYGPLSVLTHCLGKSQIAEKVSRAAFFPVPKSDSVIWKFERREKTGATFDKARFAFFLKHLFRFSNKNLANAAKLAFGFFEKELGLQQKPFARAIERSGLGEEKVNLIEANELLEIYRGIGEK